MNGKPLRVGVSSCVLGNPVRFDGGHKLDRSLRDTLGACVEWVLVCPGVEYGLPVRREPMRLVGNNGGGEAMETAGHGGNGTVRGGREAPPGTPDRERKSPMLEAAAVIAVATAAVSFVAGVGTYLFIRFTQGRRKPPE